MLYKKYSFQLIIIVILLISFSSTLIPQDNPFASGKKDRIKRKSIKYPVFLQKIFNRLAIYQHKLNNKLAELTDELKNRNSFKALFIIILLSFLYGIIHGLGPGHGKTLVFSYFLSSDGNIKQGITMSMLMAATHTCSALIVVTIMYLIIKKSFLSSFDDISYKIKLFSYGIIILIGLFLLISSIIKIKNRSSEYKAEKTPDPEKKSMWPLVLAVGIVPCPGAVIILLFSISIELFYIGVISSLLMALGMGVAISFVGILTIYSKKGLLKLFSGKNNIMDILQSILEISGSFFILLLGLFLFFSIF